MIPYQKISIPSLGIQGHYIWSLVYISRLIFCCPMVLPLEGTFCLTNSPCTLFSAYHIYMLPSSLRCYICHINLGKVTQFFSIQPNFHLLQEAFYNSSDTRGFGLSLILQPLFFLPGHLKIFILNWPKRSLRFFP